MSKILLIDDEKNLRELYTQEFGPMASEVVCSDGKDDPILLVQEHNPDLIVLDIRLDVNISGLDYLKQIRDNNYSMPIIMLTAFDEYEHDIRAHLADHYVVKSFERMDELKKLIRKLLTTKPPA